MALKVSSCTTRRPMGLWDWCLCFEASLSFIHQPFFLPTTYCLAAGIAGGWHLLQLMWKRLVDQKETNGCERQMLGPAVMRIESNLRDLLFVSNTLAKRHSYVESGIPPWWVRYNVLCSGERLTATLFQLGCPPQFSYIYFISTIHLWAIVFWVF